MNYCKYQRLVNNVSYDGGSTWTPLPNDVRQGSLIESMSPDCGVGSLQNRWVQYTSETQREGVCDYYVQHQEQSYDGMNWFETSTIRLGDVCSCETEGQKVTYVTTGGTIVKTPCDDTDPNDFYYITTADTKSDPSYSAATNIYIGNCDKTGYLTPITGTTYYFLNGFKNLSGITLGPNVSADEIKNYATLTDCIKRKKIDVVAENPYCDSRDDCNAIIISNSNILYLGGLDTVIPNSVVRIGYAAFAWLGEVGGQIKNIAIPSSVRSIGDRAFFMNKLIKTVNVPTSVTAIGSYSFSQTSLSSATVGDGVTSIPSYAFAVNSQLTEVDLGRNVSTIGSYAFQRCSGLTSVTIRTTGSVPTLNSTAFNQTNSTFIIHVDGWLINDYKTANNWSAFADRIQPIL